MKYREDVDCLRGISVLAVVFYHLKIENFSGGFLGVDIFFVISGYLISSLILNDISNGNFSLLEFYERRIRRIFPALFLVLVITFLLFNQVFLEKELIQFSKTILSTLLFYSNFYFLSFGSYFSPLNENLPLLHTWSLSIEEQFYLFFPLLIFLLKKKIKWIVSILIMLTIFSFSLSQFGGNLKFNYPYVEENLSFFSIPQFAFYFTLTRIWEILIGCLLAMYLFWKKKELKSKFLTLFGYLIILSSFIYFDENTQHPSLLTLIPITGTILILSFNHISFSKEGFLKIVNNIYLLKIGLISYSLYLWHQPIFQYFKLIIIKNFSILDKILIIFFIIIISFLSYRFVEKPFRNKNFTKKNFVYSFYFFITLLFTIFCFHNINMKDYSQKYVKKVYEIYEHSNYYINNEFICSSNAEKYLSPKKACILGNSKSADIAFIGDSHLDLISIELDKKLTNINRSGIQYSFGGCVPALNLKVYNDKRYNCNQYFKEVLTQIESNPDIDKIFLFSRWAFNVTGKRFNNYEGGLEIGDNHYFVSIDKNDLPNDYDREKLIFNEIENYIDKLYKLGKKIFIIMPTPEMGWEIPINLARKLHINDKINSVSFSISKEVYLERNKKVINFFKSNKDKFDLNLIFLEDIFCDEKRCYAHKNETPLYFDDDHLSEIGARLVSDKIINQL